MKSLKSLVKVYDNVLPRDICKRLINTFESHPELQERFDDDGYPNFTQMNLTKNQLKIGTEEHEVLQNVSFACLKMYEKDLDLQGEFPAEYALEQFRLKKYNNDGYDRFDDHVDVQDYASAKRFLTFFFYLNTVKEGGATEFPRLDIRVKPKEGRCLVFPPLWMYPHCGMIPVSHPKYIVGSYLHYL